MQPTSGLVSSPRPAAVRQLGRWFVLGVASVFTAAACGRTSTSSSGGARGYAERTFKVTVQNGQDGSSALRIKGGRVSSPDLSIDCGVGASGEALTACSREFPLGTTVVLHATATGDDASLDPPRPYAFQGWAGDCTGDGDCTLGTDPYAADKYVVAIFSGERRFHANYSAPAVHGPAWNAYATGVPGALDCTSCHGASLHGQGLALGCNGCHAWPRSASGQLASGGGVVSFPGGPMLAVGPGALAAPASIDIADATWSVPPPSGVQPVSAVYDFGPSGLVFSDPVTVTFPMPPGTTTPSIYWTTPDGTAFEDVGGIVSGETIQARITHLGRGFVGVPAAIVSRGVSALAGILDVLGVGYRLSLAVTGRSVAGSPVSSVLVGGPGITTTTLQAFCPWMPADCFSRNFNFGAVKPAPGSTYSFAVTFADSTVQMISATLADLAVGYPGPISPANGAVVSSGAPTFSWSAPSWGCVSSYVVLVSDSTGRAWSSGQLAPATTSVLYNFNGTSRLPVLNDGSYSWSLFAFDCTGPSASETRNSARVQGIPFTVAGAPGMYTVGGSVVGLTADGLTLTTPGEPPVTIPAGATGYVFPYQLATGTPYQVSVLQQPAGQACVVSNANGAVPAGNVTDVAVTCSQLAIDQAQILTDHLGLSGGTLWGQTFVPAANNFAQVDLLFMFANIPAEGITSTVGLYRDITQPPIATADATLMPVPPGVIDATVTFRFDPPVPLDPGTPYAIGWNGPAVTPSGAVMSWHFTYQDAYPDGQVVNGANVPLNPPADFVFTTYYAP